MEIWAIALIVVAVLAVITVIIFAVVRATNPKNVMTTDEWNRMGPEAQKLYMASSKEEQIKQIQEMRGKTSLLK